eukprot:gene25120-46081_t
MPLAGATARQSGPAPSYRHFGPVRPAGPGGLPTVGSHDMNASKATRFLPAHRVASLLAVSALALGLAACGKTEEPTVGQRLDSAVEKTEQAAADPRANADA